MKAMLNLSEFGWDEERKKVTAEDGAWDDYIKVRLLFDYVGFIFKCKYEL